MKKIIEGIIYYVLVFILMFRYKITVKGLENINEKTMTKPGGILFIPNHPAVFVDPLSVALAILKKYQLRPLVVEYMYYLPVVNTVLRMLDALSVPDFNTSSNSLKRKKNEEITEEVIKGLKKGDNFLIYPAGKTKSTAIESIAGASLVHRLVQEVPEVNVVLVRVKGLWGSMFSRALIGRSPPLFPTIWQGVKIILKNLIFFTPRREVIVEFHLPPADFPYKASRIEFNRYLEKWYNTPDGLTKQEGEYPGDSLVLVSYSRWRKELPQLYRQEQAKEEFVFTDIPVSTKDKILTKLSEITEKDRDSIKSDMNLTTDLGMDSLDQADLLVFLEDNFDVRELPLTELTTVGKVMAIASGKYVYKASEEEKSRKQKKWFRHIDHMQVSMSEGDTFPEVFLNTCKRKGSQMAFADDRTGIMTYSELKVRTLILAEYLKKQKGKYIGILLPASSTATLVILATQLAGKIPVMINWTIGPRHLEAIKTLTNLEIVLTSWAFLDRLQNVDFNGIDSNLVMLEDLRPKFGLKDKIQAFIRSKYSTKKILKLFNLENACKDDYAVLLFTSGTENMPKGVPLTHENILSNLRSVLEHIQIFDDDILLAFLPPFHSFGFSVCSMIPPVIGIRVAYFPDPTDGKRLAQSTEKWGASIICGAPTFLKHMLKGATVEQLKSIRIFVSGAEKAPQDLIDMLKEFHLEEGYLEGYGITECSPIISANDFERPHSGVGYAIPGVEIKIIHAETEEPLPNGEQGQIIVNGPNVFKGYINPGIASPFIELEGKKWYKTGDIGVIDEFGALHIVGRMKRFVKIGGEMISLGAVEAALIEQMTKKGFRTPVEGPLLAVCAKEFMGEKTKIYLFTVNEVELEAVNQMLREAGFSNLVKVSNVFTLPELPIMGTGKTNYRLLETDYIKA